MSMTFAEANYSLSLIRPMVASAIVKSDQTFSGNRHMAWHFLPTHLQQLDLQMEASLLETRIIPSLRGRGPWEAMIPDLVKLARLCKYFQPGPIYGCGECD